MAAVVSGIYDWNGIGATSGAPSWPIAWQPENIDDVTYDYTTIVVGSGTNTLTQLTTGTPGIGTNGYYRVMDWSMWEVASGSMNSPATPILPGTDVASAAFHFSIIAERQLDGAALEVWFVPRWQDPRGSYGTVDPDPNACSQRDWDLSDGVLVGSVSNPYSVQDVVMDLSSVIEDIKANGSAFSLVFRLADSPPPSVDTGGMYEYVDTDGSLSSITMYLSFSLGSAPSPGGTPSGGTTIQADSPAHVRAELQHRRWAETTFEVVVPPTEWRTLREGDLITFMDPLGDVEPLYAVFRVIARKWSETDGVMTASLQIIHPPDGTSIRLTMERLVPAYNLNTATDPIIALIEQRTILQNLLLRGLST